MPLVHIVWLSASTGWKNLTLRFETNYGSCHSFSKFHHSKSKTFQQAMYWNWCCTNRNATLYKEQMVVWGQSTGKCVWPVWRTKRVFLPKRDNWIQRSVQPRREAKSNHMLGRYVWIAEWSEYFSAKSQFTHHRFSWQIFSNNNEFTDIKAHWIECCCLLSEIQVYLISLKKELQNISHICETDRFFLLLTFTIRFK